MKHLNTIKKLIKLPFVLVTLPVVIIVLFMFTDWEKKYAGRSFLYEITECLW